MNVHSPRWGGLPLVPKRQGGRAAPADDRRAALVVPVLVLGVMTTSISQVVVVPLLPILPRLTGASSSTVSWMVTVTLVVGAVVTPLLGRAADMYGKRRVLLLSLAALTTGALICAVTSNIGLLITARAVQGIGAAVMPLSISILRDMLPPPRVAGAVGMMTAVAGVGATIGLPFGGVLVRYGEWHTTFWVLALLAALALVLAWAVLGESPVRSPGRFDVFGAFGLTLALVCLLLAVTKGSDWGWAGPRTATLLAVAAVAFAGWAAWELRAAAPLVDLRLSARPALLLPNIATLLIGFSFAFNSFATAQLVQVPAETGYGLGGSVLLGGLCTLPGGICMMLLSPVSARISTAYDGRVSLAVGSSIMAVGYLVRIFTSESMAAILLGATVVAVGTALAYSSLPLLVMRAVPRDQTAAANGVNVLLRTVGQATCSAVLAALLTHVTVTVVRSGSGAVEQAPALEAFQLSFGVAGTVALAAVVVALLTPRPPAAAGGSAAPGPVSVPAQATPADAAGPAGTGGRAGAGAAGRAGDEQPATQPAPDRP